MSDEALDRLAAMVGVEPRYLALSGEAVEVSEDAKRAVLRAMGIAAGDEDEVAASLASPRAARSWLHGARRGASRASCPTGSRTAAPGASAASSTG